MTIGMLYMDFSIPGSQSLKDKRRAMNSLKERLRNRFNCSVAEMDSGEKWGRARVAACVISTDSAHVHEQLMEIVRFSSSHHAAEMTEYSIEML